MQTGVWKSLVITDTLTNITKLAKRSSEKVTAYIFKQEYRILSIVLLSVKTCVYAKKIQSR